MTDPNLILDRLTARAGQLYSLPAVAMKVLDLTSDPLVDVRAVKECIENDPALTGKVLRVVNSSLFGLSREVSDLNQALSLLGTKPLKLLVLGFSLPSGMFLGVEVKTLAWYWRHTLTKAVTGRELSQTMLGMPGDEAFIAGLLQDLGILLLLQQLGEPYARFLDKALTGGLDLAAMETEAMGFSHTQLSARLLARWGLPDALVEAIGPCGPAGPVAARGATAGPGFSRGSVGGTPAPQGTHASPATSLARILQMAELVARLLADGQPSALAQLLKTGWTNHVLTEAQLETLVTDLGEKVEQLASVLSLQLPGGVEYRDVLARAQRQLAGVAGQAAEDLLANGQGGQWSAEEELLLGELQELAEAVSQVCRRPADATPHTTLEGATQGGSRFPAQPNSDRAGSRGSLTPPRESAPAVLSAARNTPPQAALDWGIARRAAPPKEADAPGLLSRLKLAVAACRQARCPLSLLLVELARQDDLLLALSGEGFDGLRRVIEAICQRVDHPRTICTAYGGAGFALILPNCERRQAVEIGDELLRSVRRLAMPQATGQPRPIALAVGVGTVSLPPKNFSSQDLLSGADRCLYGSHASGGGVVKSIEIY